MSWIEHKYIMQLSNRFEGFKQKSGQLYNIRCPFCGDSQKHKRRMRGYLIEENNKFRFYCHNCHLNLQFDKFIKKLDNTLYGEYTKDILMNRNTGYTTFTETKPKAVTNEFLFELMSITDLPEDHKAKQFIQKRKIPQTFWDDIYYCEEFKKWTNKQLPNKFEDLTYDEPRIIIPFFNRHKKYFGFQGRSLQKNASVRYITIILDESNPKIYGMNRVNLNGPYYVVEGPFDSMFVNNAIATAGGKISSELVKMGSELNNAIIVYDNEPRNRDVVENIKKAIFSNYHVVIWPEGLRQKDINDMVLADLNVKKLLQDNTVFGLEAQLRFERWKKV